MDIIDWKIETINNILPEEFYNLIEKNKAHIEKTKQFIALNQNKENYKEGYFFYPRDIKTNTLIGYLCIKSIDNQKANANLVILLMKIIREKESPQKWFQKH